MLIALPNAFGDAATNMAIDAALMESLPEGLAVFRHYGWTEPAATFGYAQRYQDVASVAPLSDQARAPGEDCTPSHATLCRRLTGGGIVDHRNDWTYALIIHASLPCATIPATTLYEQIHQAIGSALDTFGVESRLAPCPKACQSLQPARPEPVGHTSQCFVNPAANDVLRPDGRKITGAAMKRSRHGLLIQGSIDRGALPDDFNYGLFQEKLTEALAATLDLPSGQLEDIRPLFRSDLIDKEKKRFASTQWTQRR
jgi:lipoate-protein ligase A